MLGQCDLRPWVESFEVGCLVQQVLLVKVESQAAMETSDSKAVLITGCSTGIGRATAELLAEKGWPVWATARKPETIEDLRGRGCKVRRLDVCDDASMREVVATIEEAEGAVGVLINNAGYGLEGALEGLRLEDVRRQFETNLFGPLRLTQLVLPGMRRQGGGRIVNVSSVGGRITVPGGGAYHASKHAIEALSDALRFEVHGFGVDVIVIEPGAIASAWTDKAVEGIERLIDQDGPYTAFDRSVAGQLRGAHRGILRLAAGRPETVARVIERAIRATRPRTRYVVPVTSRLFAAAGRALPSRAWDALMGRMLTAPGTFRAERTLEHGGYARRR